MSNGPDRTIDDGPFARWRPFGDDREVIVRRGERMGFDYGLEQSRRTVTVGGVERELVRYQAFLSPPPLGPGQPPLCPSAAKRFTPESEVLRLPDAEFLIRREPDGFSDDEVELILECLGGQG